MNSIEGGDGRRCLSRLVDTLLLQLFKSSGTGAITPIRVCETSHQKPIISDISVLYTQSYNGA